MSSHPSPSPRSGAFVFLALARFMVMLDLSIVVLALPAAQRDFAASVVSLSWALTIYALAFGGLLLIAGKVGDLFGRRRVFLVGLAVFTAASLVGGLAPNLALFVVARGFQGVGAALISPTAFALVLGLFEKPESRQRAIGVWSSISGVAVPLGGLLGGILVATVGWRWVMEINVPVGMAAFLGTLFLVPGHEPPAVRTKLPVAGAILVTAGLMSLVFAMSGGRPGWPLPSAAFLVAGLVLLAAFALVEARSSQRIVPPSFLSDNLIVGANVAVALSMAGFVSFLFTLTFYLQKTLAVGPIESGALLLATALPFIAGTLLSKRVMEAAGPRGTIVLGSLLAAAGYAVFVFASPVALSWVPFLLGSILVGCYGLAIPVLFSWGVARAPRADQGVASGLLNASQQIGAGVGVSISAALATSPAEAFGLCVGSVVLTALVVGVTRQRRVTPAPSSPTAS